MKPWSSGLRLYWLDMQSRILLLVPSLFLVAVNAPVATAQETSPVIVRSRCRSSKRFTSEQVEAAGTGLPTWIGKFTYKGKNYHYTMVGSDHPKARRPPPYRCISCL